MTTNRILRIVGLSMSAPTAWDDITSSVEEGTPTVAKSDGVGALQFSVARYSAGQRPTYDESSLRSLITEWIRNRGLEPQGVTLEQTASNQFAWVDAVKSEDLIRVFYITDGRDLAFATYLRFFRDNDPEELAEVMAIIRSLRF